MSKRPCRSGRSLAFAGNLADNRCAVKATVTQLTDQLILSYARVGGINHLDGKNLPSVSLMDSLLGRLEDEIAKGLEYDTPQGLSVQAEE